MKSILLAGWYATRLFPLTENFPKALLPIQWQKTILDFLVDKMQEVKLDDIILVTNDKYFAYFQQRAKTCPLDIDIDIVNDGTTSNEDRLGAIWDIQLLIEQKNIDDDIFVACADNIFDFSLKAFVDTFRQTQKSCLVAYDVQDLNIAKKLWIVDIDTDHKIINFLEKPQNPPSTLASAWLYIYPKNILSLFKKYLDQGNNKGSPGNFPARLYDKQDMYATVYQQNRYDIGTFEALDAARVHYQTNNS